MVQDSTGYEIVLRPNTSWIKLELRGVWQYRDLLFLMVWRDFSTRYKQTLLGPLWFFLQPLMMTIVFTVVFGKIAGLSTDGLPPLLFYLCGQLGWNYFAANLNTNSATLVNNAGLFSKVYFPRLIVPLSVLISNLFTFGIQLLTFFAFFLYFRANGAGTEAFHLDWRVVFLPLLLIQTAILSLGMGLFLSALTAKYRDLTHIMTLLIQVWMYLTPVILPLSAILDQCPAQWQWIVALNPMVAVVEWFRVMLLGAGTVNAFYTGVSIALTCGIAVAGMLLFGRAEKTFVDTV